MFDKPPKLVKKMDDKSKTHLIFVRYIRSAEESSNKTKINKLINKKIRTSTIKWESNSTPSSSIKTY